jgi:enoyl-CoA hydratase/carnithine racemase
MPAGIALNEQDILVERQATGIALVRLNRPARRNAVTYAMWRRLGELFAQLASESAVRALVLTGNGGCFSAGADITEFAALRADAAAAERYETAGETCTRQLAALPKPTVAAISGPCMGGGLSLAEACDFRVADRTALFAVPAARLGIVYNIVECRDLLALVGLARAKRILFSGARFGAAEAAQLGIVDELADDVLAKACDLLAPMVENAPLAIAGMKRVLNALAANEVEAQAQAIATAIARAAGSADHREGVKAFSERRKPAFEGR